MIVRDRPDGTFVVIAQHDHALLSGAFADHWRLEHGASSVARFAIAYHDVAWVGLDSTVHWNAEAGRPHTFLDHPLVEKYRAYTAGIDLVATGSPYAGWLVSRHLAIFAEVLTDPHSVAFVTAETRRQADLWAQLTDTERATSAFELQLLQFCDALSLFVCLNEPGATTWPWHRDGLPFRDGVIRPTWRSRAELVLDPDPFDGPVEAVVPFAVVDRVGTVVERGVEVLVLGGAA